jgi:formiminotetrahydrofolate cyclodeaminase
MVARISSTSRPDLLDALDRSRRRFLALADLDAQAFIAVLAAYKLPQGTAEEKSARQERIQHALRGATDVPLEVMGRLSDLFPLAADVIAGAKPTVVSDAGIAVHLLAAGLKAARYNVAINLKYLRDEGFKDKTEAAVAGLLVGKKERRKQLLAQVKALLD